MTTDRYDQALALLDWSASLDEIRVSFEEYQESVEEGCEDGADLLAD